MIRRRFRSRAAIGARQERRAGQGLVEFAALVPVFLLILLGMLEFGFAFSHHMTLEYATREGARAGASMADGSITDATCGNPDTLLAPENVDPLIIAAVQRVLESPGSMIDIDQVMNITIYQVTNGSPTSHKNVWEYRRGDVSPGSDPDPAGNPTVPCQSAAPHLDFHQTSATWPAAVCTAIPSPLPSAGLACRNNSSTADSIGVSITYTYKFRSALGGILRFFGGNGASSLAMTDTTVMALEPTH